MYKKYFVAINDSDMQYGKRARKKGMRNYEN